MTRKRNVERRSSRMDSASATGKKPVYEAPVVLRLWDMHRGLGNCVNGDSDTAVCLTGANNHDCYDGSSATDNCSTGSVGTPP